MTEIISLNWERKARARKADRAAAAEHRVKFGRSKAQKAADRSARARAQKTLDLTRRDP